ncbi:AbiU2 domain-containing protein [Flavobacterium micromati]|nr:hypothetical protein [Flavobacterium micromati]
MNLKDELEIRVNKIWDILQLAKESFYYSYYLHKPHSVEELNYINSSNHFAFIKMSLWKVSVIELSKLFNKTESQDKFNLNKLLVNLKSDGHFRSLKLSSPKLADWEKRLAKNRETIKQIIDLRDKVYSHTDKNNNHIIDSDITFEKTEKLIKLCEEIIQVIFIEIFDADAKMNLVYFDESFKEIPKILAQEENRRKEKIIEDYKRYSR